MSLIINNTLPKTIQVVKDGKTTELKTLKINNNDKDTYVWAKPYTLRTSKGSNSSLTVTRISSKYANADTGILGNKDEIYYGDEVQIVAAALNGYKISMLINGAVQRKKNVILTVDENIIVTVIDSSGPV